MNIAYTAAGKLVELQGSAENAGGGFDLAQMDRMVELGVKGCRELMELQQAALR
jgi:ribonuclease PH